MANQPVRHQMAAAQFAAKFKSKRECHRFLCVDVGAYIPPLATVTIYHMRDLIGGDKRVSIFNLDKHTYIILTRSSRARA